FLVMSKKQKTNVQLPPVVEPEPPKEEHLQQTIEQEGFGRFEYRNGLVYEGQWKLFNNQKVKHGEGVLIFQGSTSYEAGNEEYRGSWEDDQMNGFGVYKYTSGAIYSGEWKDGKHNGKGIYEFPDGTLYEGEWKEHKMHGEGYFIDKQGNKWEGEFVQGIFQSKMQKELKMEKMLKKKEQEILQSCIEFFQNFNEAFSKSDKKTFKENLLPFFVTQEEIKLYVGGPYPKFEDKTPDKWNEIITYFKTYTMVNVLRHSSNAKILQQQQILSSQFNGLGQIVEFQKEEGDKIAKLVLCNAIQNQWTIVYYYDNIEPEVKKKK
ncbi:MORN repeat protein, partial [Ichthyophthirius multifiliis]